MNDAFTAELALTIVRDHGLVSTWQLNVIADGTTGMGARRLPPRSSKSPMR
jgi:hypothetical protein